VNVLYTAEATATGDGRNGKVASSDGLLLSEVAVPAEMGGSGGATNPEQLFAAGYAACFHNALRRIADRAKVPIGESTITARVGLGRLDGGRFGLTVALIGSVPGVDRPVAEDLMARAHEICPYSNATRGNIDVTLEVV
jgi:osmotically inducible protein OsmC